MIKMKYALIRTRKKNFKNENIQFMHYKFGPKKNKNQYIFFLNLRFHIIDNTEYQVN